jgi:hypothetical protein
MQDLIGRDIPLTLNVDPMHVLTNDSQMVSVCVCILILILTLTLTHTHTHTQAVWQNEGLPADRISLENGAIITNCNRWPLLIDPQLQGIRYVYVYMCICVYVYMCVTIIVTIIL